MGSDDKEKLKTLLKYWIEHNREHSEEFQEWAEKAQKMGEGEVGGEIMKAVGNMDKVTEILSGILRKLEA
jgi:rubrerythrin